MALLSSPHSDREWQPFSPMSAPELIKELVKRGAEISDVRSALSKADPDCRSR